MRQPERTITIILSIILWPAALLIEPAAAHLILGITAGVLVSMLAHRFRPETPVRPASWENPPEVQPTAIPRRGRLPIAG